MNIGLDVGYSAVKAIAGNRRVTFPSAVGTPDRPRFSLDGAGGAIILAQPDHVQVGEGAVQQSRFLQRREDRRWTESAEWYALFCAALTELSAANVVEVRIVTGLPIAFYEDRASVRERLLGDHRTQREGRHAQTFKVTDCRVIPQPFGALLATCLDDRGRITDTALATGAVGILDVGGKTTNLLSVNHLSEIGRETASVNVGAWDAVRAVRSWLDQHCPDLELRDHQVIAAVIACQVRYYGEPVDLTAAIDDALLVGGGGALLGRLAQDRGEYAEARRLYQESLAIAQQLGDRAGVVATTLHNLGTLAQEQGEYAEARRLYHQSLAIKRQMGDHTGVAQTLNNLGALAQGQGEYAEARRLYQESLDIAQQLGDRAGVARTLHNLGMLAQDQGEYAEARRLYQESLDIRQQLGDRAGVATTLAQLALLEEAEDSVPRALELIRQAEATFTELRSPYADRARRHRQRLEERSRSDNV